MISTVKEGLKVANVADAQHSAELPMKKWNVSPLDFRTVGLRRAWLSWRVTSKKRKRRWKRYRRIQPPIWFRLISHWGSAGLSHCRRRKFDDRRKLVMVVKLCPMPELVKICDWHAWKGQIWLGNELIFHRQSWMLPEISKITDDYSKWNGRDGIPSICGFWGRAHWWVAPWIAWTNVSVDGC